MSHKRVKVPPRRIEDLEEERLGVPQVIEELVEEKGVDSGEAKPSLLKRGIVIGRGKLWQVRLNVGFGLVVLGLVGFTIWMMVK